MKKINVNRWILKAVPSLAPLPTAYVIFDRLQAVLHWPWYVAGIAAAVTEMIGFRSIGLAVEMYQFNRTCSAVEQKMRGPLWQSITTVVVYIVAVLGLTVLLEIVPTLSLWSPVAFVGLGLTGGWLAALTTDQDEREGKRADDRAKALRAREASKASKPAKKNQQPDKQGVELAQDSDKLPQQVAQGGDKLQVQVAGKADKQAPQESKQPVQDEALLAYWRDNPKASDQQVALKFGKSRQAMQQRRLKLIEQGSIKMTPRGVEIVGISVALNAEVTK